MRLKKLFILIVVIATLSVVSFFIYETYRASVSDGSSNTQNIVTPSQSEEASKSVAVSLAIGNSIAMDDFVVAFLDITEDSRCPMNAQCVWAGRVVAKIAINVEGQSREESIELGKPLFVEGYSVFLDEVKPDMYAGQVIQKDEYRGVFKIEKATRAVFTCTNGTSIATRFISNEVELTISDREGSIRLPIAISASGARYANNDESVVFWNKGNTAFMTENGVMTYEGCVDLD